MDNRLSPGEQPKKKRGRPPGSRKTSLYPNTKQVHRIGEYSPDMSRKSQFALSNTPTQDDLTSENLALLTHETKLTPFNSFLHTVLVHDRSEITRIAKELDIAENTVYRWMNGSSDHPRPIHLRRLPDVLPEYRSQLINIINQTFGDILETPSINLHEVYKDIYFKILELHAATEDDESRFWQISQEIFEYALEHLDPDKHGLAITFAKLMPPYEDGIHSLREISMRGHDPWPSSFVSKAFLGSTTLAGNAMVTQRMQSWNSNDPNNRLLVEIDEFERGACATPIMRGTTIAGVLIVSSTKPDFFVDPMATQAVSEYGLLMNVALSQTDFYPASSLHLRPMPDLNWQREYIARSYAERMVLYARTHVTSRRATEIGVQQELELEFEKVARTTIEQNQILFET